MHELTLTTEYGNFSVRINSSNITQAEKDELYNLALKWTSEKRNPTSSSKPLNLEETIRQGLNSGSTNSGKRELGSKPVKEIHMGTYVEPAQGVNIQILDYPQCDIMPVIKELILLAPLSATGWSHILRGNFDAIKFSEETAKLIHKVLKEHGIYATWLSEAAYSGSRGAQ